MSRLFEKIENNEVYVIAEMSANHGGSYSNAIRIINEAKRIGADCLKIQTYTADTITIDSNRPEFLIHGGLWDGYRLYDLYKDASTPWEWQEGIKKECDRVGIDFLSTPFDKSSIDFLESIGADSFKIASFELVDIPLIRYAAAKGKPMIISCGMGTEDEISDALEACYSENNHQVVLLKCCSEYPAKWEDMHLSCIPDMKKRFGVNVGLSDHSSGSMAAVIGVALGACVVEKHIKLPDVDSPDSGFSMTVDDFSKMISDIKDCQSIKGDVFYGPTKSEDTKGRRSVYAVRDIAVGEAFSEENVRSIRPSPVGALKPKYYDELLGKKAKREIKKGEPIIDSDLFE